MIEDFIVAMAPSRMAWPAMGRFDSAEGRSENFSGCVSFKLILWCSYSRTPAPQGHSPRREPLWSTEAAPRNNLPIDWPIGNWTRSRSFSFCVLCGWGFQIFPNFLSSWEIGQVFRAERRKERGAQRCFKLLSWRTMGSEVFVITRSLTDFSVAFSGKALLNGANFGTFMVERIDGMNLWNTFFLRLVNLMQLFDWFSE